MLSRALAYASGTWRRAAQKASSDRPDHECKRDLSPAHDISSLIQRSAVGGWRESRPDHQQTEINLFAPGSGHFDICRQLAQRAASSIQDSCILLTNLGFISGESQARGLPLLMTNYSRAAVGFSDYPSASNQRHIKDSLAPLEGILRTCRHDG